MTAIAATVLLTAADLGSKHWALGKLSVERVGLKTEACEPTAQGAHIDQRRPLGSIVLVKKYLEFRYAENCGAAFGLMRTMPSWVRKGVFYGAAIGVVALLWWLLISGRGSRFFVWSVPLITAGALGNLYDRMTLGYVVDFIRFHLDERWSYPTFNVADVWITVGVILILIDSFVHREPKPQESSDTPKAGASSAANVTPKSQTDT